MSSSQCEVAECGKKVVAKQLCQYHYDRLRRYGDLTTRPETLVCQDCGVDFKVRKTGNLPKVCDPCFTERHRAAQRSDRRRKGLWEQYKMTVAQYQEMYQAQNGRCKICNGLAKGRGEKNNTLAVDHNHDTGKIRGLLCTNCNTGIGNLRDDIQLLEKAIKYLQENN